MDLLDWMPWWAEVIIARGTIVSRWKSSWSKLTEHLTGSYGSTFNNPKPRNWWSDVIQLFGFRVNIY